MPTAAGIARVIGVSTTAGVSVRLQRVGADTAAAAVDDGRLHLTASTMKLVVLFSYLEAVDDGRVDPRADIRVHSDFPSADGIHRFDVSEEDEDDLAPWRRETAPLQWLVERMVTRSSNLATDLVIEAVGLDRVVERAQQCDPDFRVRRWIDDVPAIRAGILNQVSASALATTFHALAAGTALTPAQTSAAVTLLAANTWNDEIPAGLPPGTRVAHKNGWDDGIRHDAGIVFPDDAPAYVLVVLTTGLADGVAQPLIADVSAWAWAHRDELDGRVELPADLAERLGQPPAG